MALGEGNAYSVEGGIRASLATLSFLSSPDTEGLNCGHVGDLERIAAQLKSISEREP